MICECTHPKQSHNVGTAGFKHCRRSGCKCKEYKNHSPQGDTEYSKSGNVLKSQTGGTFNLSEKIVESGVRGGDKIIYVKDVKTFIKKLKEEVYREHECDGIDCDFEERVVEIIDKLAGDKLR